MNTSKTSQRNPWKGLAFLVLMAAPMFIWAIPSDQKKEQNQPPPKPQVQQRQQPKAQPQQQQPKPKPQQQQPKPKPQQQQAKPQSEIYRGKQQPFQEHGKQQNQQFQQHGQQQQQFQQHGQQQQQLQQRGQQQFQQHGQQQQQFQQHGQQQGQQKAITQRPLTPAQSQQQVQTLNRSRGKMTGINGNPLPQGHVTMRSDGSRTLAASGGRQFQVRPNGTVSSVSLSGGRTATFRQNGGVATVRAGNMQIDHGLRGERRIVAVRPDHSRVVSLGPHRGFVERPYMMRGGRSYVQRTYWVGGRGFARVYRTSYYRGVPYYHYVPPFYFHPRFYGWAYNPWGARAYYRWPWFVARSAWFLFWGPYFAPAPVYDGAAFWLTDFLLAENLRAAYEAGQEAQANAEAEGQAYQPPPEAYQQVPSGMQGNSSQITPEMKEAIAEEVRRQIAAEQQSAATPAPPPAPTGAETPPGALDPARRLFVVSNNLTASTVNGQDCELTGGDIITRLDDTPDGNNQVRVSVSTSKGNDCRVGSTLMVEVSDLQDMQNQARQQMDAGLKTLADNSGKGGLPAAPDTGTSPGEVPLPKPDANVDSTLQAQQQAANQTEVQVQQETAQPGQNY